MNQEPHCNENWHIFAGGFPNPGDVCRCGQKQATEKVGELKDVKRPEPALGTTELGMAVPVSLKKPASAWSGGEHTGERLTSEQRAEIRDLWAAGHSKSKIATLTKHSRNTISSVIDGDPEVGEHLRKTRATRMLVEEENLRRMREEVLTDLEAKNKLKPADLTNAMMVASVATRDAGGAEPQRLEVSVDHSFKDAAELMNGGATREPLAFAPIPKTIEAELLPVETPTKSE